MFVFLIVFGGICLAVWLVMLFRKSRTAFPVQGMEVASRMNMADLNPENLRRNLARYADNRSALAKYVTSLKSRFEGRIEIKDLEQYIRKANVRKGLADAAIAMLRAEREWQRLPQEEDLIDAQVETKRLKEQVEQQDLKWKIKHEDELRELKHQYEMRELEKKTADLDRKPPEPKPRPSPREKVASKLAAEKEVREQIQGQEREELRNFRLGKRPNPAKDREVYEDEAVWLADWREVGGEHEDFVLGEYENIKKRYRKMLDDALEELNGK